MTSNSDSQTLVLVHAALAGDEEAFAALYARYSTRVFGTAYLMLGDTGDAEEITQDVFMKVHRKLDTYKPELSAFATWLHRITVNACLNRRRRWLSWLTFERLQPEEGLDLPSGALSPLERALHSEEQRHVWQAVQRLPVKLRAAIVLRYYHNMSYEEIAQVLQCPIGTVRSRLHSAHKRLLHTLESSP